jgi:hypothetical protein
VTPFTASNRDRRHLRANKISFSERLSRLATSPWALSCSSFLVTALLIRSNGLTFF